MKLSCPSCDVITAKIHYIDTKTAHKQGFFYRDETVGPVKS